MGSITQKDPKSHSPAPYRTGHRGSHNPSPSLHPHIRVSPVLVWAHTVLCILAHGLTVEPQRRGLAVWPPGLWVTTKCPHFRIRKGLRFSHPAHFSYGETEAQRGERTSCVCSMLVSYVYVRLTSLNTDIWWVFVTRETATLHLCEGGTWAGTRAQPPPLAHGACVVKSGGEAGRSVLWIGFTMPGAQQIFAVLINKAKKEKREGGLEGGQRDHGPRASVTCPSHWSPSLPLVVLLNTGHGPLTALQWHPPYSKGGPKSRGAPILPSSPLRPHLPPAHLAVPGGVSGTLLPQTSWRWLCLSRAPARHLHRSLLKLFTQKSPSQWVFPDHPSFKNYV